MTPGTLTHAASADDDGLVTPVQLDVRLLNEEFGLLSGNIWGIGVIRARDVLAAIGAGRFIDRSFTTAKDEWDYEMHVARVAYLAAHGWKDPIEVDVGIPSMGYFPAWPIQDGNHRFAAALIMGDKWIWADAQGEVDEIQRFTWRPS